MAKITDANIWLGDRYNQKQALVAIPAGPGADDPGILVLESTSAAGAANKAALYLWADSSNNLRFHTSKPTTEDSDGSVLGTLAVSNVNKYLSNLDATTAINSSLVSDTTLTDDLGSSSIYWNKTYSKYLYANSTAYLDGSTAGDIVFNADLILGVSGTGKDLQLYGDNYDVMWDASADSLKFKDNAVISIGTGEDITIKWDATDLLIDGAAGNTAIKIGSTNQQDLYIYGETATNYIQFDTDDSALDMILTNFAIVYNDTNVDYTLAEASDALSLTATDHSSAEVTFGGTGTNGMNFVLQSAGSGDKIVFDAGAQTWTATHISEVMTGEDSQGTMLAITGIDTTGNSDTMTINHSGTGAGLKITATEVDSLGLSVVGPAAQTTSLVKIDGSTGTGWDGADNVGMLHLVSDSIHVNAGATMLYVANSAQSIASAEGTLARFINTGTARASAVMVEINAKDGTETALSVPNGMSLFDDGIVTAFDGAQDLTATPTAAEFDTSFGTTAKALGGFVGVAEDTSDGKNYLVVSDGTTWHYVALTAAA